MMHEQSRDDEPRIDLSAIDPDRDPAAADRFVDGVMARVAQRPIPLAMPADPLIGIWSMFRSPVLAAGIVIAVAVGAIGVRMNRGSSGPQTIVQAMGVPPEFLAGASPMTTLPDSR